VGAGCRPVPPATPTQASGDPYAFELLEQSLVLQQGAVLRDRSFVLSSRFRGSAAIVIAGSEVAVRDVRILGPGLAPADPEGPAPVGIRVENVRDVAVDRVSIQGLPSSAILGQAIDGGLFRDVTIRDCRGGIRLGDAPSRGLRLERIYTESGAGAAGGAALSLAALRDSVVTDCCAVGEMSGSFELTNPQKVRIQGVRGASLRIQGTVEPPPGGDAPVRDVVIEDCLLDKGLGHGAALSARSCLELSQTVGSVRIERCILNAAAQNGHAIELSRNSHGRVVDCTIRGFNGVSGAIPSHAVDLSGGSSVNDDFERVNHFVEQKRIRSDRNRRPGRAPA